MVWPFKTRLTESEAIKKEHADVWKITNLEERKTKLMQLKKRVSDLKRQTEIDEELERVEEEMLRTLKELQEMTKRTLKQKTDRVKEKGDIFKKADKIFSERGAFKDLGSLTRKLEKFNEYMRHRKDVYFRKSAIERSVVEQIHARPTEWAQKLWPYARSGATPKQVAERVLIAFYELK